MALTKTEKEMIQILTNFNITEDEGMSVAILLRDDTKRQKMISFLKANPQASGMDIVEAAAKIREE